MKKGAEKLDTNVNKLTNFYFDFLYQMWTIFLENVYWKVYSREHIGFTLLSCFTLLSYDVFILYKEYTDVHYPFMLFWFLKHKVYFTKQIR